MIVGYKERNVKAGAATAVYYNIPKQTFSVKQDGLVVLHSDYVVLVGAEFQVSETGRQRVLREQRKNVHAQVYGRFVGVDHDKPRTPSELLDLRYREAYYNPYKVSTFVDRETGREVNTADIVVLTEGKVFYK